MTTISESKSEERLIIGSQLKKARKLLRFEPEEVAKEINVSSVDIISWEKEQSKPNLKQLEALANFYGRDIDYFVRETPTVPEKIEFRGKPEQSLRDLPLEVRTVLSRFDDLCRSALEFETLLNKKRETKLPHFKESEHPKNATRALREKFNVGDKPLSNLRNRLEDEGIRIFELPVPEDAFSGFSFWHKEYGPCILLNYNETKGKKNFTLAHELAHLLYNHEATLCYIPQRFGRARRDEEYNANQFAIELLLPKSGVIEDFKKRNLSVTPSQKELGQLANKWGVSIQALGYRLENFELIKKGYIETLLEPKPFRRRSRTPKWEKQLGKRYVEISFEAHQKGIVSTGKLAHSLGITIREAMREIEQRFRK
ncbi:MAG: XRE family transcriptional regulator [Nitrospirota bacterium]